MGGGHVGLTVAEFLGPGLNFKTSAVVVSAFLTMGSLVVPFWEYLFGFQI